MAEPAVLFDTILEAVDQFELKGENNVCTVCGSEVKMMVYRGTGVCCQLHDRVSKGQLTLPEVDMILAGVTREDGIK